MLSWVKIATQDLMIWRISTCQCDPELDAICSPCSPIRGLLDAVVSAYQIPATWQRERKTARGMRQEDFLAILVISREILLGFGAQRASIEGWIEACPE